MDRDFTFSVYKKLCKALQNNGYLPITVNDFIKTNNIQKKIIMRHDVDRKPIQALKMAQIENHLGFTSTYYFRTVKGVLVPDIINKIAKLGHEIGYHYEVLALNKGNKSKAIKQFETELAFLREICDVKTICMHGSPLSPWRDLDLWKSYNYEKYNIIGEPYLSIDYGKVHYFTDTGRRWNGQKYNVRDVVNDEIKNFDVKSTKELISIIPNLDKSISINAHPHRWHDKFGGWVLEYLGQNIKNLGKRYILKNRRKL